MSIFIRTIAIPSHLASVGLAGRNDRYLACSPSEHHDVEPVSNGTVQFESWFPIVLAKVRKHQTIGVGKGLGSEFEIELPAGKASFALQLVPPELDMVIIVH